MNMSKACLPIIFALVLFLFVSCENHRYDSDNRQITAKDLIRYKTGRVKGFDIISFKEDTLKNWPDTAFKNPLRYTLDFHYNDSTGALQNRRGEVVFTPDGRSVINVQITNE
jgi:hypothetical protein